MLRGDDGHDTVEGGAGQDSLDGGAGDDRLRGEAGHDTLDGQAGHDDLDGGDGDDLLHGQEGDDALLGSGGHDTLWGGTGDDALGGYAGDDVLHGEDGNDVLKGGEGNDLLHGETGHDTLYGGAGDDSLDGAAGEDHLYGDGGDDTLLGGLGADTLWGGDGHDRLDGHDGNDVLDGGAGDDRLLGGLGDDMLSGGAGHDTLDGGGGRDQVFGRDRNDILVGGPEVDYIDGGAGSDVIVLTGRRSDYLIRFNTAIGRFAIVDLRAGSPDGTDLADIEVFRFSDGDIAKAVLDYMTYTDEQSAWDVQNSDGSRNTLGWRACPEAAGQLEAFIERRTSAGALISETVFKPDGSRLSSGWDVTGTEPWDSYVQTFDPEARLVRQHYDTGAARKLEEWDPDNAYGQDWSDRETELYRIGSDYLALSQHDTLDEPESGPDPSIVDYIERGWDRLGQHGWSELVRERDSERRVLIDDTTYDDGSRIRTGHDYAQDGANYGSDRSPKEWVSFEERYDPGGNKVFETYTYYGVPAEGRHTIVKEWDYSGQVWADTTLYIAGLDRRLWKITNYDAHPVYSWTKEEWGDDPGGWSTRVTHHDVADRSRVLWQEETWIGNGVVLRNHIKRWDDTAGIDWSEYETFARRIDGVLATEQETILYDNGTYRVVDHDVAGEHSDWKVRTEAFYGRNEARPYYRTYLGDDDTFTEEHHDLRGTNPTWAYHIVKYTQANPALRSPIEEETLFDDGTFRTIAYDPYDANASWDKHTLTYKTAAQLPGEIVYEQFVYDDGRSETFERDLLGRGPWKERTTKEILSGTPAQWRTYYQETISDTVDGREKKVVHEWEQPGLPQPWLERIRTYDDDTSTLVSRDEIVHSSTRADDRRLGPAGSARLAPGREGDPVGNDGLPQGDAGRSDLHDHPARSCGSGLDADRREGAPVWRPGEGLLQGHLHGCRHGDRSPEGVLGSRRCPGLGICLLAEEHERRLHLLHDARRRGDRSG